MAATKYDNENQDTKATKAFDKIIKTALRIKSTGTKRASEDSTVLPPSGY